MAENLIDATKDEASAGSADAAPTASAARPAGLPDKFWDDKRQEVRLDALLKSYLDLERKLGAAAHRDVPEKPEEYEIQMAADALIAIDPEVNRRLHAAGFSREQAQLVYDLASERLVPLIVDLATDFEAENQVQRLEKHFGDRDRWREVARQLDKWGRAHLPEKVFEALATTFEGVLAMYRMMSAGEPGLIDAAGAGTSQPASETDVKALMRDPRYWRDQDPAFVQKVRAGFQRLYPDNG